MDWSEFFFGGWDHPLETLKSDLIGFTSGKGLPVQQAAGLTNASGTGGGDDFTTWFSDSSSSGDSSSDTGTSFWSGYGPWAIAVLAIVGIVAVAMLLKEVREF